MVDSMVELSNVQQITTSWHLQLYTDEGWTPWLSCRMYCKSQLVGIYNCIRMRGGLHG